MQGQTAFRVEPWQAAALRGRRGSESWREDVATGRALDPKARQIGNIAALIVIGAATPQLQNHINVALDVGCSRDQIREVIMQMTVYAGLPAALNSLAAANEVFAKRR